MPAQQPERGSEALSNAMPAPGLEIPGEAALVASIHSPAQKDGLQLNSALAKVAVELDVAIPVREFRVRSLLALEPGHVIRTHWQQGEDMPLGARGVQLAWSEFEVVDSQLAVRVTRLV